MDDQASAGNFITDLFKNSIEIVTWYSCAYHPGRIATAICESCKTDLCSECAVIRGSRLVCKQCLGGLEKAVTGKGIAPALYRFGTHPLTVAAVIILALSAVFASCGRSYRKGLLGQTTATTAAAEEQLRLEIVLFLQKAGRIEKRGDDLRQAGRINDAANEYEQAAVLYDRLIRLASGRWEENPLKLAKARVLQKSANDADAMEIYQEVGNLPFENIVYSCMALFSLAKLQERYDPETAVLTYERLLHDIVMVPDSFSSFLKIVGHTQARYNYESRVRYHTRTDIDFEKTRIEALLNLGRLLVSQGKTSEARYRLERAAEDGIGTSLGEEARGELMKIFASEQKQKQPEDAVKEEEKIVITHFD